MSLASKFGNFEIKKSDRISQEDKTWLTHREELYKRAVMVYKSVYDIYKAENESYSAEDRENFRYSNLLVGDFGTTEKLEKLQNEYIGGIFGYFSNKYNVKLENKFPDCNLSREYYRRRNDEKIEDLVIDFIDYHTVLDSIFDQLGGMSFQEKAEQEIKDILKRKSYIDCRDLWEIKVKGNKFTYNGGYCHKDYGDDYKFSSTEWLKAFLNALSFIEYGEKRTIPALTKLYDSYYVRLSEDDIQNGFTAISVGVKHIKFFKNGRVDITFKDAEFCRMFAREWCGYTII